MTDLPMGFSPVGRFYFICCLSRGRKAEGEFHITPGFPLSLLGGLLPPQSNRFCRALLPIMDFAMGIRIGGLGGQMRGLPLDSEMCIHGSPRERGRVEGHGQ
jgi:hypothetical protein